MIITRGILFGNRIGTYVCSKKMAEVYQKNLSDFPLSFVKAGITATGYKISEGFKEAKKDIKFFYNSSFSTFSSPELTKQQILKKRYEIRSNLLKLPIVGSLFMLPLGIPIIMLYMHYLPCLSPAWFRTDLQHQKQLQEIQQKSKQALNFFIECGSIRVEEKQNSEFQQVCCETSLNQSVFRQMSLKQKRKLSELLFGEAQDGTTLVERSFSIKFEYFLLQQISEWMLVRNVVERINFEECQGEEGVDNVEKLVKKVVKARLGLKNGEKIQRNE